jgi:hypothetical protein
VESLEGAVEKYRPLSLPVICQQLSGSESIVPHRVNPTGVSCVAVAKPFILPTRSRKRGNPNWGKPIEPVPDVPTAFEEQVQKMGLTEHTYVTSEELRQWCQRNKDRCYIPEWLLKQWGMPVDPNVSG